MQKDSLDHPEEFNTDKDQNPGIFTLITWWENRRLTYNIVVGLSGLLGLWIYGSYQMIYLYPGIAIEIVIYGIIANVFYSMGWALEILRLHYKIIFIPLEDFKELLYYTGIFFSVVFTFLMAFLLSLI